VKEFRTVNETCGFHSLVELTLQLHLLLWSCDFSYSIVWQTGTRISEKNVTPTSENSTFRCEI